MVLLSAMQICPDAGRCGRICAQCALLLSPLGWPLSPGDDARIGPPG